MTLRSYRIVRPASPLFPQLQGYYQFRYGGGGSGGSPAPGQIQVMPLPPPLVRAQDRICCPRRDENPGKVFALSLSNCKCCQRGNGRCCCWRFCG